MHLSQMKWMTCILRLMCVRVCKACKWTFHVFVVVVIVGGVVTITHSCCFFVVRGVCVILCQLCYELLLFVILLLPLLTHSFATHCFLLIVLFYLCLFYFISFWFVFSTIKCKRKCVNASVVKWVWEVC